MAGIKSKVAGMSPVRRKQMVILAGLVGVVGVIAFGAAMLGAPKKAPPPRAPESTRKAFGAPGEQVNNADIFNCNRKHPAGCAGVEVKDRVVLKTELLLNQAQSLF